MHVDAVEEYVSSILCAKFAYTEYIEAFYNQCDYLLIVLCGGDSSGAVFLASKCVQSHGSVESCDPEHIAQSHGLVKLCELEVGT